MLKKISLIAILACSHNAYAFDFNNYTPTLDKLYENGLTTINSGYKLDIDKQNEYKDHYISIPKSMKNHWDFDYFYIWTESHNNSNGKHYVGLRNSFDVTNNDGSNHMGGAITNITQNIIADFFSNKVSSSAYDRKGQQIDAWPAKSLGGAIYNTNMTGYNIIGDFIRNRASSDLGQEVGGGAIYNRGNINNITSIFLYNEVENYKTSTYGGAIYNIGNISNIIGDFIGNGIKIYEKISDNKSIVKPFGKGGAIYNAGSINTISANFLGNYAQQGGAIYTTNDINFVADSRELLISGNYIQDDYDNKIYNAIYSDTYKNDIEINFRILNNGNINIHDTIDGNSYYKNDNKYNIQIIGDNTGYIAVSNSIRNADTISINNSQFKLIKGPYNIGKFVQTNNRLPSINILNGSLDIANGYVEQISLNKFDATKGTNFLHLDIDNNNKIADTISANAISGTFNLIINSLSDLTIQNTEILFATAVGSGNKDTFKVYRVYGSPYLFDVVYKNTGITNNWYLSMNTILNPDYDNKTDPDTPENPNPDNPDKPNPDNPDPDTPDKPEPDKPDEPNPDKPKPDIPQKPTETVVLKTKVYPEIIAFTSLPSVLLNQTRTVADNIIYTHKSGLWIQPMVARNTNKTIVDTKSNIKGLEFGISKNGNNDWNMGVFGSVLNGSHDINGDGKYLYSHASSDINTTSVLFGGYLKYRPKTGFNFFASVYGGKLNSEINTNDGIKVDNTATQLTAKSILGYDFNLGNVFAVGPQIGGGFTQLDIDDSNDNFGKTAVFDKLNHIYGDLGLNIRLMFNNVNMYIKPAYMITFNNGNELSINGLNSIKTIDNKNLLKIDTGIDLKLTNNSYANITANYITGSDYSNIGVTMGFSVKF